jgi:predicted phage terminase large subunit-like protein
LQLQPAKASQILLERKRIRRSVAALAEHLGHRLAAHHRLVCEGLEWAFQTPDARLVITAPPGSAKSRYATQIGPASWLSRPVAAGAGGILVGTHTAHIAELFGGHTRRIIAENSTALGYGLDPATSAKARFNTSTGREYFAVGVGTGISGIRAGLGVLDDLYPTRFDAESQLYRDRVWSWLLDDFFLRLVPGAPVVAVNTRWHEDDHVARLEDMWRKSGTPHRIINIRAEAEEDDPLGRPIGELLGTDWEGWDYPSKIRQAKAEMHASARVREYEALFQQRPSAQDGDYFQREWIIPVDELPDVRTLRIYGASDYAVTDGGGDWTVHVVVGVDPKNQLWLLDLWRAQASPDKWIDAWCQLVKAWRPNEWAEETGQIRSGVGPFLIRRAMELNAWCARRQFPTRGDKAIRAQSMRGRMAMGGLRVRRDAGYFAALQHELLSFPAGKHDDQVDALGLVGQLLDHMDAGSPLKIVSNEPMRGIEKATLNEILRASEFTDSSYL